jgi:putative OmpL-like beta-barrel porin-2
MRRKRMLGLGLAVLLGGAAAAQAQEQGTVVIHTIPRSPIVSVPVEVKGPAPVPVLPTGRVVYQPEGGVQEPSRQAERAEEIGQAAPAAEEPALGPTLPENVKCLQGLIGDNVCSHCGGPGLKVYGWIDAGYTYASTGPGLLTVEPRENRFGNEFLLNQIALVVEKPLDPKEFSLGFNATFYAGADAALLRPEGGFTTTNPRFGADFRQLYVSAHLPILTEGGVDVKVGRMGTIIGYESALAPYRPFYSNDYQWFYAQDGAFTGALAIVHMSKQLDVIAGITMGANTFFTMRGDSPCFIGQVNYWTTEEKNTLLSASTYIGHEAIFAAPEFTSSDQPNYTFELRIQHKFSKCFEVIIQSDDGWANEVPIVGTGSWFSLYGIGIYHASKTLDVNSRLEWFDDEKGTRTGFATNYYEATLGLDYHPVKYLRLRPEIRGDFADDPVFRNGRDKSQLTLAIDGLISF